MMFKRQRGEEVSVNLTPLIDVVFLLLIFFMVSTTFKKESHISLNLPEASGEAQADEVGSLEIVITENGDYAINGQSLVNTQLETLKSAISELGQGDTSLPVIISADAMAPHQSVVRAMDAAGQMGYLHLSISTRTADSEQ